MRSWTRVLIVISVLVASEASGALGWRFEYDDADRVTAITDPAERSTRFEYVLDESGDRLRKRVRVSADGERVVHDFDDAGRLVRMADAVGALSYGYDARDRLVSVQRGGEPAVRYGYDTRNRLTSLRVGDHYRIDYTYDFLNRLVAIKTPVGVIEYEYRTGQGQVLRRLPNGVITLISYDPKGALDSITHGLDQDPSDSRFQVLTEYSYRYRPDGLISAIDEHSSQGTVTKAYRYDKVGRLIEASGHGPSVLGYGYDALGNRLRTLADGQAIQEASFDWAGRLTSLDGRAASHDAAANLTSLPGGRAQLRYRFNGDGRLVALGTDDVIYAYDGEGRLISRTAEGARTRFVPNPVSDFWQPLVIEAPGGSRTLVIWEDSTPLMLIRDGKPEYLMHDHLGSVRLVTDAEGRVTRRFEYAPFGGPVESQPGEGLVPRFAGLFWDDAAKAYLTMARAYRPDLGRFLQPDPILRIPQTTQLELSLFGYCGNDPINSVDVDGAEPIEPAGFNRFGRWLDSFSRAFSYHSFGWLDSFFERSPLTVNTDPDVRDSVVGQVISEAWQQSGQNSTVAWATIKKWREQPKTRPDKYRFAVTDQEWKAAENYGYARQWIETGQGLVSLPKGPLAAYALKTYLMPAWDTIHAVFEPIGVPPRALPISGDDRWLPITAGTRRWWNRAVDDALLRSGFESVNLVRTMPVDTASWDRPVLGHSLPPGIPPRQGQEVDFFVDSLFFFGGPGDCPPDCPGPSGAGAGPSGISPMSPSSVGGVYLGGAGQALEGIGLLEGVTNGPNGDLILVAQDGDEIALPPLRLDDVVTIFRSVYLHGEGPTVTIDPDPEDPTGPQMLVRHGEATDQSYVGWILYQADRLMKGYQIGEDNITRKLIPSSISGYEDVLETVFFGDDSTSNRVTRDSGSWERFWIVPSAARRFAEAPGALTLLDVPLRVRTQPMKWENGQLVDDPDRAPSPGAAAFTQWFTDNYDGIAEEQFLLPPPASGITEPVPVFAELRRIALITAIAETLRDQDVPLPFWMRDYDVRPVPFERTTPSLEVTRTKGNVQARIFGGVNLSPPTEEVDSFENPADLAALPKAERPAAQARLAQAKSLTAAVDAAMTAEPITEALQTATVEDGGEVFQMLTVPGGETRALGPARLDEIDVLVPMPGGDALRLVRRFNSFFEPDGPWGPAWALDLPRLVEQPVPVERTADGSVTVRTVYELVSPLNSQYARFSRIAPVPSLNDAELLVPDRDGAFVGLANATPDFLTVETRAVIRKDGATWHFSEAGHLLAIERNGTRIVYERDAAGRVARIVGRRGDTSAATIELDYEPETGRIQAAHGQRHLGQAGGKRARLTVRYAYDETGKLVAVESDAGRVEYRYDDSRVTAVAYRAPVETEGCERVDLGDVRWEFGSSMIAVTFEAPRLPEHCVPPPAKVRRFEYGRNGQLLAETDPEGVRTEYRIAADASGHRVTAASEDPAAPTESMHYDPAFRPMEARLANGTTVTWDYPDSGGESVLVSGPDGEIMRATETADRQQRTLELDEARKLVADYDDGGRLTALRDNNELLLQQEWYPDGRLQLAADAATAMRPAYDKAGLMNRLLLMPAAEQGAEQIQHWREARLDVAGWPREVTDFTGLRLSMDYDALGNLTGLVNERNGENFGYRFRRDADGRLQQVESSWGEQTFAYDAEGLLQSVRITENGAYASMEWQSGQLTLIRQFDGGQITVDYADDEALAGLPKRIALPNDLVLEYRYDDDKRLSGVGLGGHVDLTLSYDDGGRLAEWSYRPGRPDESPVISPVGRSDTAADSLGGLSRNQLWQRVRPMRHAPRKVESAASAAINGSAG